MAVERAILELTYRSAADLSADTNLYKFVELTAQDEVNVCNAATDRPIGVLQNQPGLGGMAVVRMLGVSKTRADAAIAVNVQIGTSADGEADAKTAGTDTTEYVVGTTLEASNASGDYITCAINCLNPHRAA